jgi:hypothetical protein
MKFEPRHVWGLVLGSYAVALPLVNKIVSEPYMVRGSGVGGAAGLSGGG